MERFANTDFNSFDTNSFDQSGAGNIIGGGGIVSTGGGAGITYSGTSLIQDRQYFLEIRSNVAGANILINGALKATTPKNITINLSEIRDNYGLAVITLEKTNYKVSEEYRLRIINNPNFGSNVDFYSRQYQFTNNTISTADTSNQILYSGVLPYIVEVKRYVGGVEDTLYTNSNSDTQNFVLEYNLTPEQKIELPVVDTNVISTAKISFSNPLLNSVKIITNDINQKTISSDAEEFIFDIGTKIEFVSSDIQKYRLTKLSLISNGQTQTKEATNNLESIRVSFVLENNISIIATSEEIFIKTLELPSINVLNEPDNRIYNVNSKSDYPIAFKKSGIVNSVRVIIGTEILTFNNLGDTEDFLILIPASTFKNIGVYKIGVIPRNNDGDGEIINLTINAVDDIWVGEPDIRNITYPSIIQGADYVGTNVDFKISWESVNTDYVLLSKTTGKSYLKLPATGKETLNVQTFLSFDGDPFPEDGNQISISLKLTPYNISGKETIIGKDEIINIAFSKSDMDIPRPVAINRLADAFISQLDVSIFDTDSSKYLTHTLNLGDGDNKVITTWTGSEGSLILKLYEPLPTSVQQNQQVWIAKSQSNPILETITLSNLEEQYCSPLKGPNFSINQSNDIGYKIYDELIASGSDTSNDLILKYFESKNLDTTKLNIEYTSASVYLFENFTNFGSAQERINNFFYKIELLENYQNRYKELTSGSSWITSIDVLNESNKVNNKIYEVKKSFDGFENFLYTDETSSLAYPKSAGILLSATSSNAETWFNTAIELASDYDKTNPNYLVSNIPGFLIENSENSEFILFLSMIGQHFDSIWQYINALKKNKKLDEAGLDGVPKYFVSNLLKSFGWNAKRAFDSQFLWEYALGQTKNGVQKYSVSLEDANNQVWRRILNNLPYLLKHKGTSRALKAAMACYGVPQSMLTIMEFGGPQDPTKGGTTEFTFDDRTASILLKSGSLIKVPWKQVSGTSEHPQAIEFMLKPELTQSYKLVSGSNFALSITSSITSSVLGFNVGNLYTQSAEFSFRTDRYSNILINKTDVSGTEVYNIYLKTGDGTKIITTSSLQLTIPSPSGEWESGNVLLIGNDFTGALDEFRLWRVPLEETKFENHTLFPDSINGNSYTASTADLLFRLDFEYPKDRNSDPYIKNVAINTIYDGINSYATASNFYNAASYPYQYIPYERTVTAKVPSLGFTYSNKIRNESQFTFSGQEITGSAYNLSLSYKQRVTKKSYDKSPIDSNRLGLFFSPIKELNMDIVKAFGDFNIDNYIGDSSDDYKDSYKELEKLRTYYFERLDRNVYEYIQLIKYINKSLFDVLSDLSPARAKISKGLLIEPHYLERSKTRWDKPQAANNSYETIVSASEDFTLQSDYSTYEGEFADRIDATFDFNISNYDGKIDESEEIILEGTNPTYGGEILYETDDLLEGTFPTYTSSIEFSLGETLLGELESFGKYEQIGMDKNSLANLGFGLYAPNGTTEYKRFIDLQGNVSQSRNNIFLVTLSETKNILTQTNPNEPLIYEDVPTTFNRKVVSILPFNNSVTTGNTVTAVSSLKGYFPTHYRYVNGLSTGLERSYWEGSKQTSQTTPDSLPPVETFTTNPNILRVAKTGRGSGEPILEVD